MKKIGRLVLCGAILLAAFCNGAEELKSSREYIEGLNEALRAKKDVWGEKLLQKPEGPTYENIKDYLHPLLYGGSIYTWLSESKVHYLPFGMLDTFDGGKDFALTVADGSQILSDKIDKKRSILFYVGEKGNERYGSNLRRSTIALHKGYLPILETEYTDTQGNHYRQESFALKHAGQPLASFIQFTIRPKTSSAKLKITLSDTGLTLNKDRLISGDKTYMVVSDGSAYQSPDLTYTIKGSEGERTIYLIRLNQPGAWKELKADAATHAKAKAALISYWEEQLAKGRLISVPEELVMNAQKNLIIQNLLMGSRYSIGNSYEVIFHSEASDAIQAMGWLGFTDFYRDEIVHLTKGTEKSGNWVKALLLKDASYYDLLTKDASLFNPIQNLLTGFVSEFAAQMKENPDGLLRKERGGTDISTDELFYSMHFHADAWRGMRDISTVWKRMGHADLGKQTRSTADSFQKSLRKAIDQSKVKLPDGSLFVPVTLLGSKAKPFDPITETAKGSYWLLVAPYGLASGIFEPGSTESKQILSYLYNHGAFFLGMLRFNYAGTSVGSWVKEKALPAYRTPGVDNVYAPPLMRLLADHDEADRLVLAFYGKLAHGMTRNTFVSGEGDEVGVFEKDYYRTMYLPPNSTNNALFLYTLRLLLIHETVDQDGLPLDLNLAASTPRGWLEDGKQIQLNGSPTLFGPLSLAIDSHLARGYIDVALDLPDRDPIRKLKLRLRTPGKREIAKVELNGSDYSEFSPSDESVALPAKAGKLTLRVYYR